MAKKKRVKREKLKGRPRFGETERSLSGRNHTRHPMPPKPATAILSRAVRRESLCLHRLGTMAVSQRQRVPVARTPHPAPTSPLTDAIELNVVPPSSETPNATLVVPPCSVRRERRGHSECEQRGKCVFHGGILFYAAQNLLSTGGKGPFYGTLRQAKFRRKPDRPRAPPPSGRALKSSWGIGYTKSHFRTNRKPKCQPFAEVGIFSSQSERVCSSGLLTSQPAPRMWHRLFSTSPVISQTFPPTS